MRKLSILIVFSALFLNITAQDIILSEIPTQNLLPAGDIVRTFQDSEGYIWYGTTKGGLYRDDGYTIKAFRSDMNTPNLLESNRITCITEDDANQIWFGTRRGMYILNKENYEVRALADDDIKGWVIVTANSTSDGTIWVSTEKSICRYNSQEKKMGEYSLEWEGHSKYAYRVYEDPAGIIWVVLWKGGFMRFDPDQNKFIPYSWPFHKTPSCILKGVDSPYYWIGTWGNGVVRFDPNEEDPEKVFAVQTATIIDADSLKKEINNMEQDHVKQHLWVVTQENLYEYEITDEGILKSMDTSGFLAPGKKLIHNVVRDRSGNIWATSHYPSSFILSFQSNNIFHNKMPDVVRKLGLPAIPLKIIYDKGDYWFWQMRLKLGFYQTGSDTFTIDPFHEASITFEKSRSMDGIFAVKRNYKVVLLRSEGNKTEELQLFDLPRKQHERIRTLHEDPFGNLWVGTTFDLIRFNLQTNTMDRVWENIGIVNCITTLPDGSVCIATESNGFLRFSPDGEKHAYNWDREDNYLSLAMTPDQNIWIRTQQGRMYFYDSRKDMLTEKIFEYDFSHEVIYDAICDNNGNLWILADQKIIIYNPDEQAFHLIHCSDPSVKLNNFLSIYKDEEGRMHVGGTGGVAVFFSYNESAKPVSHLPIRLTDIRVNGEIRTPGYRQKEIILQPNERNLELFFSTFDPINRDKIRFAFRYKGQESYWNHLPEKQNNIYLTELSKGNYELEIKVTDKNGTWSDKTTCVFIRRLPAWYETRWAYTLYAFWVLLFVFIILMKYLGYQKKRQQLQLEEQIAEVKYRFFTNVSHELRTPLALIITPLETIIKKITDMTTRQQLQAVSRNAQGLLALVNQLLDFRKIEMGGEVLSLAKGDIDKFLHSIYENFRLMGDEKNLKIVYESELSSFYIFYDHDKLRKVVNNLLSNAIKFTGENGTILLSVRKEKKENRNFVVISVEDTGRGIPENQLSNIFERFRQVDVKGNNAGSGIGLHLVKEYAALHQGSVTVKSVLNKGSVFSIYMPTNLSPDSDLETGLTTENPGVGVSVSSFDTLSKKILIVEDNREFCSYMKNELKHHYIVYEATNGHEGEKLALEIEPDIIITDLMMPVMDGIELCRRIKNNIETSHIPVILLTANDDIENERRGYKEGADAYIGKPFHWDILLSRIQNLMEQKMLCQQEFEKSIQIDPRHITISSLDEQIIKNALKLIEKNISNSEYTIEDLSLDMGMSRVSLYRKINSISGNTPTEFVRSIRLKRAAELLKEGKHTIAEVAYSVGFSTPGYFTQSFKKTFGVLPTQYNQSH